MTERNYIIFVRNGIPELYGNLKEFCRSNGLKYGTYVIKEFPFEVFGGTVFKTTCKTSPREIKKADE